jgi:hypothetical protein
MALVIWAVFLTDLMRRRMSRVEAIGKKSGQGSVVSGQRMKSIVGDGTDN